MIRGGMGTLQAEKLGPLRVRGSVDWTTVPAVPVRCCCGHAAGLAGAPRPRVAGRLLGVADEEQVESSVIR